MLPSQIKYSLSLAGIKSSKYVGKLTSSSLNNSEKFSRKLMNLNFLLFVVQSLVSDCIASIEFLFLRIMVDKWKTLEFLSPSLNHTSLDFCLQNISCLKSHSFSSDCKHASNLQFSSVLLWLFN